MINLGFFLSFFVNGAPGFYELLVLDGVDTNRKADGSRRHTTRSLSLSKWLHFIRRTHQERTCIA